MNPLELPIRRVPPPLRSWESLLTAPRVEGAEAGFSHFLPGMAGEITIAQSQHWARTPQAPA